MRLMGRELERFRELSCRHVETLLKVYLPKRCRFGRIVRRDVPHGRAFTRLLREAYADGRARP